MARNLELKARLHRLDRARQIAAQLSGGPPEVLEQTDTYFLCPHGRLKLREIVGGPSQLVAYARPDQNGVRTSDYRLVSVSDGAGLKAALTTALDVWGVVRKRREASLVDNVRIHLDQVEGLGTFLEFEALLATADDELRAPGQLQRLSEAFGLQPDDLIAGSYSDLVLLAARA